MTKITFIGAGSTIFAKNILGDCMINEELSKAEFSLFDINENRLNESYNMLSNLRDSLGTKNSITKTLDRKDALRNADYIINAIQVGGYEPSTVIDFEVPKKYGLEQTIADTIGPGGIMRALRTLKVMDEMAKDIEEVCPEAWLLNYVNPMSIVTGYMQRYTKVKTIGLCHSVQVCVQELLEGVDLSDTYIDYSYKIAGINHMAWLLEVKDENGNDLYPIIKDKAFHYLDHLDEYTQVVPDLIRFEMMRQFGYYITESSEHAAEYYPYFIKKSYPELIEKYRIPIDEYLTRCVHQIEEWSDMRDSLVNNKNLSHQQTREYGAHIIAALESGKPYEFGGNVINKGMISNLPNQACVEVTCVADSKGITPQKVGELPPQLAALNMTHVNVHELVIQAYYKRSKQLVYQAALLDPHTSAELSIPDIKMMVDELIEKHGSFMPELI